MRTDRSGCFDRTLEARSWTQTETLMRFPMSTTSRKNSPRPEGSLSCGAGAVGAARFSGSAPAAKEVAGGQRERRLLLRRHLLRRLRRTRPRQDGRGKAPDGRGRARERGEDDAEREHHRHQLVLRNPRLVGAVEQLARDRKRDCERQVGAQARQGARRRRRRSRRRRRTYRARGWPIARRLAPRWPRAAGSTRRSRGRAARRSCCAGCSSRRAGRRGTRRVRRGAPPPRNACAGAIFGCTLGNLAHFVNAHRGAVALRGALRTLHATLGPVAAAVPTITGNDAAHLGRALACHCVLRSQARRMPELRAARLDTRRAHPASLGAAAALLVAYTLPGADDADLERHGALNDVARREPAHVDAAVIALDLAALGDAPPTKAAQHAERRRRLRGPRGATCTTARRGPRATPRRSRARPRAARPRARRLPPPAPRLPRRRLPAGAHIASDTNGALLERNVTGRLLTHPTPGASPQSGDGAHPEVGVVLLGAASAHALARAPPTTTTTTPAAAARPVPSTPSASSQPAARAVQRGQRRERGEPRRWGAPAPRAARARRPPRLHLVDCPTRRCACSPTETRRAADGARPGRPGGGLPTRWLRRGGGRA